VGESSPGECVVIRNESEVAWGTLGRPDFVISGSSFDLDVDPDDFSWLLLDCAAVEDGVDGMWDLDPIETLRDSRF